MTGPLILLLLVFGALALLVSARRDPDNWRIDLGRMRPTFNHYKELALIGLVLAFLLAAFLTVI